MVLVASETGHVYTYSTEKFKPLLNSQQGRKLIRTCLSDKSRSGQDEEDINIDEVKVDQLDSDENMDFEHEQGDVDVRYESYRMIRDPRTASSSVYDYGF